MSEYEKKMAGFVHIVGSYWNGVMWNFNPELLQLLPAENWIITSCQTWSWVNERRRALLKDPPAARRGCFWSSSSSLSNWDIQVWVRGGSAARISRAGLAEKKTFGEKAILFGWKPAKTQMTVPTIRMQKNGRDSGGGGGEERRQPTCCYKRKYILLSWIVTSRSGNTIPHLVGVQKRHRRERK